MKKEITILDDTNKINESDNSVGFDQQKATNSNLILEPVYQDFVNTGHEALGYQDLKFPEILLVQDNSKYILKKDKDIRAGMFFNTITNAFSETIDVIPLHIAKFYDIRIPKDVSDVSYKKIPALPATAKKVPETNYYIDPELNFEHKIFETYLYIVINENFEISKIEFQKTRHKMALKFNTLIKSKGNKPSFRFKYRLKTFEDSFKNKSWFNIDMDCISEVPAELYNQIGNLYQDLVPHINDLVYSDSTVDG
jgi:hypothetical protein